MKKKKNFKRTFHTWVYSFLDNQTRKEKGKTFTPQKHIICDCILKIVENLFTTIFKPGLCEKVKFSTLKNDSLFLGRTKKKNETPTRMLS